MYLADQVIQLAYDPGIKLNEGGLPGLNVLKQVMGSINLFGLIAVVGHVAGCTRASLGLPGIGSVDSA